MGTAGSMRNKRVISKTVAGQQFVTWRAGSRSETMNAGSGGSWSGSLAAAVAPLFFLPPLELSNVNAVDVVAAVVWSFDWRLRCFYLFFIIHPFPLLRVSTCQEEMR
jgi:hypothetical protein